MGSLITTLVTQTASCASILGLYFTLQPTEGKWLWWQWGLIALPIIAAIYVALRETVIHVFRGPRKYHSTAKINSYMRKWVASGGRVVIFSRDMSWADEPVTRHLLREKAQRNELTVCLEHSIPLTDELQREGATIITYGELVHVPRSRFTIVDFDRDGARVAVGVKVGNVHLIQEFRTHPFFASVLALMPHQPVAATLDAGCGIGFLTNLLTNRAARVVGVDASAESIEIARAHFGARADFMHETLESHSAKNPGAYDIVVANMVLMDVPELKNFISALYFALRPKGVLIFSITHPCFWPDYYGYGHEPWYRYDRELIIESPFRITARPDCTLLSTHIHRPLETYIGALRRARFSIDELHEPMPSPAVEARYPAPWRTPRYLICRCRR